MGRLFEASERPGQHGNGNSVSRYWRPRRRSPLIVSAPLEYAIYFTEDEIRDLYAHLPAGTMLGKVTRALGEIREK